MKSIAIVPTYNERANLPELIEKIQQYAPGLHVLVVDDNSPDGTGALADELHQSHPDRIFVLHREKKEGLGRAYVDGFKQVLKQDYECILQMDGDLSHDPEYLPRFFEKIQSHDLVVGSRYIRGISVANWDLKRLIMSKLASNYVRFVTRMPYTDGTSGYNCWRREALEAIDFETTFSNGYVFLVEMKYKAHRKGFKIAEVPIIFVERKSGNSKLDWRVMFEGLLGVLKLRMKY